MEDGFHCSPHSCSPANLLRPPCAVGHCLFSAASILQFVLQRIYFVSLHYTLVNTEAWLRSWWWSWLNIENVNSVLKYETGCVYFMNISVNPQSLPNLNHRAFCPPQDSGHKPHLSVPVCYRNIALPSLEEMLWLVGTKCWQQLHFPQNALGKTLSSLWVYRWHGERLKPSLSSAPTVTSLKIQRKLSVIMDFTHV